MELKEITKMEENKVYKKLYEWVEETNSWNIELVEANWKEIFIYVLKLAIDKDYFPHLEDFKWPANFYDEDGLDYDKAWKFVGDRFKEIFGCDL